MPQPQRKSISNLTINPKKRKRIARTSRETSCECCRRRKLKCTSARPACSICIRSAQLHGLDPNDAVCHYSIDSIHTIEYDRTVDQALKQGCCVVDRELKQQLANAISQLSDKQRRGELGPVHSKKKKKLDEKSSSSELEKGCALETAREQISAPRRSMRSLPSPGFALTVSTEPLLTPCKSSPSPPDGTPSPESSPTASSPLSSLTDETPLNTQEAYPDNREDSNRGCQEEATNPKIKSEPANELTASASKWSGPIPAALSPSSAASPPSSGGAISTEVCSILASLDSRQLKEIEEAILGIEVSLSSMPAASSPSPSVNASQGGGSYETETELAEFDLDGQWKPPLLLSEEFWLPGPLRKEELCDWRVLAEYDLTL
ncbi:BQ2448_1927 [Microbotryum intermedium]|uniref:BQ2448_1927 protein n=1 Tax=Microbotryum intermedium TaxID=269621 RepID=A0A238FEW2_9BASI|nr:BQ2448_1927 [Microbotryum intermedium]